MRSFFGVIVQVLLVVLHLLLLAPLLVSCHDDDEASGTTTIGGGGIVLVLGATGRTGSLLYHELVMRQRQRHHHHHHRQGDGAQNDMINIIINDNNNSTNNVRALVRSIDKAREILHCNTCNEKEGIYIGDIQNLTSLLTSGAFENVQTVAIATGVSGQGSPTTNEIKAIEFTGIQNAARALAAAQRHDHQSGGGDGNLASVAVKDRRIVFCSSRGTTTPSTNKMFGDILFYKLNAEAFLGSIGMVTSIVKPCGLSNDAGNNRTLLALHDDAPTPTGSQMIPRADVARVMSHLVMSPPRQNLRFDLCSIEGPATTDLYKLVDSAKWDWQDIGGGAIAATATTSTDTMAVELHGQQTAKISLHEAVSRTMQNVPFRFLAPK